jgi:hypothetical protein
MCYCDSPQLLLRRECGEGAGHHRAGIFARAAPPCYHSLYHLLTSPQGALRLRKWFRWTFLLHHLHHDTNLPHAPRLAIRRGHTAVSHEPRAPVEQRDQNLPSHCAANEIPPVWNAQHDAGAPSQCWCRGWVIEGRLHWNLHQGGTVLFCKQLDGDHNLALKTQPGNATFSTMKELSKMLRSKPGPSWRNIRQLSPG